MDLASLIVNIDARSADNATASLNKLSTAGGRADAAIDGLGDSSANAAADMRSAADAASEMVQEAQSAVTSANALQSAHARAQAAINEFAHAQALAETEMRQAKAAYKAGELSLEEYKRAVLETKSALSLYASAHSSAMKDFRGAINQHDQLGQTYKAGAHHLTNLGFQFNDLGVQMAGAAASGEHFGKMMTMAVIQQGSQIAHILGSMKVEAAAAGTSLTAMFGGWLKGHPVLLAVLATLGVLVTAIGLANREFNKSGEDLTKGMNLTKDQMDELKDKGVSTTATLGDTFKGFFVTLGQYASAAFNELFPNFSENFNRQLDAMTSAWVEAFKFMGGHATGTYYAVTAVWADLPGVFGDLAYQAANAGIEAFNEILQFINGGWMSSLLSAFEDLWAAYWAGAENTASSTIDLFSWLGKTIGDGISNMRTDWYQMWLDASKAVRDALFKVGADWAEFSSGLLKSFGEFVRKLATGDFDGIENPFAGKAAAAAKEGGAQYKAGYDAWGKGVDEFGKTWRKNRDDIARARITQAAGDPGAGRKDSGASKAESLARELAATEALIVGLYKTAAAYKESTAAGKQAEITATATAEAMKKQADVATYVALQLRKYVAEQVKGASGSIAQMREQNEVQAELNRQVATGSATVEDAAQAMIFYNQQRDLMNAKKIAEAIGDTVGIEAATQALKDLIAAQQESLRVRKETEDLAASAQTELRITAIGKEAELEARLGEERLKALRSLSGDALENELARINVEREKGNILLQAEAAAARETAAGHHLNAAALLREGAARAAAVQAAGDRDTTERTFEQNKSLALGVAHDVAGIIGGGIGDALDRMIDVLNETLPDLFADLGAQFGEIFKELSEGAKTGSAIGGAVGSKTGGAIGGAVGQAAASVLGIAGPLGAIAGGLLGGIVGGMLKSTPRASATVSIIAGKAMESAVTGSSGKLKAIAGSLADSVIGTLADLATQLGAEMTGDASISIGVRKGDYRVDPTGQGITKTSKGAVDFGEDKAAAIAYATQLAVQQGVLGGLSESLQRLIMADGDFQTNLKNAISFKGVFDELAKRDDPAKWAQDEITKWHDAMAKIFEAAGATADELAALERLTGLKRVEAAEQAAKAIEEATDGNEIRQLEIEIMRLSGNELGALTAQRELEQVGVSASVLELMKRRDALLDEVAATQEAAAIVAEAKGYEIRLAEAQGDATKVLALQRNAEREAASALGQAMLDQIYSAEDAATAARNLADAQAKQAATAKTAEDLWIRIYRARGNESAAKGLEDKQFLGGLPEELQGLGRAALDAEANIARAAERQANRQAKDQAAEAGRQAAEQAREQSEQKGLQARQQAEQEAQAFQQQIIDAYERESSALLEVVKNGNVAAASMRDFAASLFSTENGFNGSSMLLRRLNAAAGAASNGDQGALGDFQGIAREYLQDVGDKAETGLDYRMRVAAVATMARGIASAAENQASVAQTQYDLMTKSVEGVAETNKKLDTLAELLARQNKSAEDLRADQRAQASANVSLQTRTVDALEGLVYGQYTLNVAFPEEEP